MDKWNNEAPHRHAFEALKQLPTVAEFKPYGFIQNQHQHIISKILVGSVVWWFAQDVPDTKLKAYHFSIPDDTLVVKIVEYDNCFTRGQSVVSALQGLYSQFAKSRFSVFDFHFIGGQIDHSLR